MTDIYPAVEAISDHSTSVAQICQVLTVSRSAFYSWQQASGTIHEQHDEELVPLIRIVFRKHKRRYGARRIADELRDMGYTCSVRRVRKLLKRQGLKAIGPKSFQPKTTDSKHRLCYRPNLLLDAADPDGINQLWVGDKQTRPPTDAGGERRSAVVITVFEEESSLTWQCSGIVIHDGSSDGISEPT